MTVSPEASSASSALASVSSFSSCSVSVSRTTCSISLQASISIVSVFPPSSKSYTSEYSSSSFIYSSTFKGTLRPLLSKRPSESNIYVAPTVCCIDASILGSCSSFPRILFFSALARSTYSPWPNHNTISSHSLRHFLSSPLIFYYYHGNII